MINTSAEYKEAILKNRVLHHETKIEFTDGTVITAQDADLYTFKISDNTSNTNSFDIGAAIAKQLEIKIDNIEGTYSERNFSGAKITARVGLELSETTEWLKKGIFYAEPGTLSGDTVSVTALDSMTKFDKSYTESKLQYPATLGQIVRDTCSVCNASMSADIASFPQSNFVVTARPSDTSLTFRQVLQYVGEIACLFFKINEDDELTASWYNTSLLESENIKENTETVKVEDYTGTIETDDVVVTGIKVVEESTTDSDTEKNETEYLYGTKGYVLEIKENKLIQDGKGASVAEFVGKKVNGLTFRPLTIKCQGDPAIEAGDIAVVTDRKGKEYKTILTGATYTAKALQELLCGAVSPERLSSTRYSKATQVYRELRKTLTQQQSEFSKALEGLKNAMNEKQGLYPVTEKQEDGSNILYFCDKPTKKESKVVIELNAKGWGMSTDGGETWNAGTLVDGTTITKILNTIGINADWINTGALTVKDNDGNVVLSIDASEGKLIAKLAEIGDWNVDKDAIYKYTTVDGDNYRVYFQPPSQYDTRVLFIQKRINGLYKDIFAIAVDGSLKMYSEITRNMIKIDTDEISFWKYNENGNIYSQQGLIHLSEDNELELHFSNKDNTIHEILNPGRLAQCYGRLIYKSYGNTEITTNGITKDWVNLKVNSNISKYKTGFCEPVNYSGGIYSRIKVKKKGVYHFTIRVVTHCPSAYKRMYIAPLVNGDRYASYTDMEYSIIANTENQTLKNYVLELEKNDEVGFMAASADGVAFYVKIQDMNVFALDYEGKYSAS